jgi:hypothetical protein
VASTESVVQWGKTCRTPRTKTNSVKTARQQTDDSRTERQQLEWTNYREYRNWYSSQEKKSTTTENNVKTDSEGFTVSTQARQQLITAVYPFDGSTEPTTQCQPWLICETTENPSTYCLGTEDPPESCELQICHLQITTTTTTASIWVTK